MHFSVIYREMIQQLMGVLIYLQLMGVLIYFLPTLMRKKVETTSEDG